MNIQSNQKGFTIVELLIIIVVIAILAAITVVAFNGIQTRAKDSGSRSNIKAVVTLLELYNAQYGDYPAIANYNARMCVGTGYQYGMCNIWSDQVYGYDPSPINDKLSKVGTVPSTQFRSANDQGGTYVSTNGWNGGGFSLVTWANGTSAQDCPSGFSFSYGFSGAVTCYKNYLYKNYLGA